MNWRWLIFDYIPRDLSLTTAERKRISKRAYQLRHRLPPAHWVLFMAGPIVLALFPYPAGRWMAPLLQRLGLSVPASVWLGVIIAFAALFLAYAYLLASLYVGPTRHALREAGYDVCLRCGYWLRGLPDDIKRCPECGTAREPMPRPDDT